MSATIAAGGGPLPEAKSCIDDNDFGSDPLQGEDDCFKDVNGLHAPRALVISPDGKYVYAASEDDEAITIFKRDKSSGKLKPKGCVDDNDTGTDPQARTTARKAPTVSRAPARWSSATTASPSTPWARPMTRLCALTETSRPAR